jgi:hypothetical protein
MEVIMPNFDGLIRIDENEATYVRIVPDRTTKSDGAPSGYSVYKKTIDPFGNEYFEYLYWASLVTNVKGLELFSQI